MQFDTVELAIEALRKGESIIVVDDEDRENEGDLIAVTEWMADDTINFMAKEGRGLICAPLDTSIAKRLELNAMEPHNTDAYGTHFTVSVDHKNTTTGISAYERTMTARALIDHHANAEDFNSPGH